MVLLFQMVTMAHHQVLIIIVNLVYQQGLTTKPEVLHAESNAISKLARSTNSSDGATVYLTCSPCFDCAKLIIQAGIKRVVYSDNYRDSRGLQLLEKANIQVEHINDK